MPTQLTRCETSSPLQYRIGVSIPILLLLLLLLLLLKGQRGASKCGLLWGESMRRAMFCVCRASHGLSVGVGVGVVFRREGRKVEDMYYTHNMFVRY